MRGLAIVALQRLGDRRLCPWARDACLIYHGVSRSMWLKEPSSVWEMIPMCNSTFLMPLLQPLYNSRVISLGVEASLPWLGHLSTGLGAGQRSSFVENTARAAVHTPIHDVVSFVSSRSFWPINSGGMKDKNRTAHFLSITCRVDGLASWSWATRSLTISLPASPT